jgi:hypothetical protein
MNDSKLFFKCHYVFSPRPAKLSISLLLLMSISEVKHNRCLTSEAEKR